ncbi:nuclear transport factor 2 family protein [Actibacterium sp. 188UL27-1]|uniref:nuclear transport factor 2 family protein n=1 Tax=Actibacterium sp. 188UL27-1 TaxID=2786961 RepID=UPI00195A0319|nr:nuclear transport factor 2 family protein [Actibacterium sp. 188UL27-1]MBM7069936.1 nuclear transport factor 2 family protein [Actibacterium sp. 188UL27-1]
MNNFSNKFRDFPDYILGITEEIWEQRGLGPAMKSYYHPDVIVRTPSGIGSGEPSMTKATLETLHAFPDRVLLGEDVIWSGTPEDGMLSSHRILSQATHLGDGPFGPATGKQLTYRAFADCFAQAGQINDEWLVRDNGAIVRQMGHAPRDWAQQQIDGMDEATRAAPNAFTPQIDRQGPYTGAGNDNPWGAKYADLLERIMRAELSVIPDAWDRACSLEYPGGVSTHGHEAADRFWLGLRAAFPSAHFTLHHVMGRDDDMMSPRAAIRWSLWGRHDGWGIFGAPTGAQIYVMGIAHAEFGPWGLRREYVMFDETAIWMQILSN